MSQAALSAIEFNSDGLSPMEEKARQEKARNNMVWIGTFTIAMFFAALTSGYLISSSGNFWVVMDMPTSFWISSIFIVLSSVSIWYALKTAKSGAKQMTTIGLVATILLTVGFTVFQFKGWGEFMDIGAYTTGKITWMHDGGAVYGEDYVIKKGEKTLLLEDGLFYMPDDPMRMRPLNDTLAIRGNTASSYIWILTGMHLVHLAIGWIILLVVAGKWLSGRYGKGEWYPLKRLGIYWHFLSGLWIYLFLFLQYIH